MELLSLLYDIFKVRKEGLMSIESDVDNPSEPIFSKYPMIWPITMPWNSSPTICG